MMDEKITRTYMSEDGELKTEVIPAEKFYKNATDDLVERLRESDDLVRRLEIQRTDHLSRGRDSYAEDIQEAISDISELQRIVDSYQDGLYPAMKARCKRMEPVVEAAREILDQVSFQMLDDPKMKIAWEGLDRALPALDAEGEKG